MTLLGHSKYESMRQRTVTIVGIYDLGSRDLEKSTAFITLEEALRDRRIDSTTQLALRSDNGLVFGAKAFVRVARRYGLTQEYITPYTPEQNGMTERLFGTLKSECVWQYRFQDRDQTFDEIARSLNRYHADRPHSAPPPAPARPKTPSS